MNFNLEEIERLRQFSPTDEELAAALEVSAKTIQRKKAQPEFAEAMERGKARRRTLRRMQTKLASEGNATMQIWLGKQLLGQRDLQSQEANGGPTSTQIQLVVMQAGTRIDARPGSTRCWISRVSSKSNSSTLGEERIYD